MLAGASHVAVSATSAAAESAEDGAQPEGLERGEGVAPVGPVEAEEVEPGALGELTGAYLGLTKDGGLGGVVVVARLVRPVGELEVVGAGVEFTVGVDVVGVEPEDHAILRKGGAVGDVDGPAVLVGPGTGHDGYDVGARPVLVHRLDEYPVVAGLAQGAGDLTRGHVQAEPRGQALGLEEVRPVVHLQAEREAGPDGGVALARGAYDGILHGGVEGLYFGGGEGYLVEAQLVDGAVVGVGEDVGLIIFHTFAKYAHCI